jgi:hypothetical protein
MSRSHGYTGSGTNRATDDLIREILANKNPGGFAGGMVARDISGLDYIREAMITMVMIQTRNIPLSRRR